MNGQRVWAVLGGVLWVLPWVGLHRMKSGAKRNELPTAMDIFRISPTDVDRGLPLEMCKEGLYMVNFVKDETGTVKVKVRHA